MKQIHKIYYSLVRLFCILLLLFNTLKAFSNPVVINQEMEKEDISQSLLFFKDVEGKLTAKDIIERLDEFISSGQKITNLGITSTTHWAICSIENKTDI